MSKATLSWSDPTLKFTNIEVSMRVKPADGTPPDFTVLKPDVAPGAQTFQVGGLPDGDYEFRVTPINGTARGTDAIVPASIVTAPPADVPPGAVSNLQVSISPE